MPAPTLLSLCKKEAKRNVRSFTDVGDLEYSQISSILKFIQNPEQLHELETNCPQLAGEDAELWQSFIARDVPDWSKKNYCPKNPKKWYDVYRRYMREQKEEVERDSEKLKQVMMGMQKERESKTVRKVVNTRILPTLPRDPRMVARDGNLIKGARSRENGRIQHVNSDMRFSEGSKTKMTNGASVLLRAKREAKEIGRMNKLLTPMGNLGSRATNVNRAPQAMVDAHRRAALPVARKEGQGFTAPHTSGPAKLTSTGNLHNSTGVSMEEKERRLREKKLMTAKQPEPVQARQTVIGSDSEDDDIFSTKPEPLPESRARRPESKHRFLQPTKPPVIRREAAPIKRESKTDSGIKEEVDDLFDFKDTDEPEREPERRPQPSRTSPQTTSSQNIVAGVKRSAPTSRGPFIPRKKTVDCFNRGGAATLRNATK